MKRIAEISGWYKSLFALIFSAAVFLYMVAAVFLKIDTLTTRALWQLFWSAMLVSAAEFFVLERGILPGLPGWVKLFGGYGFSMTLTLLLPEIFCFITGDGLARILYSIILTVFFFGVQLGLHIFYKVTGAKFNQLLDEYKLKTR